MADSNRNDLNLIWIDLEMTGLDTLNDHIIEIATLVTDPQLNILAEGPIIAIHQPLEVMQTMDEMNNRVLPAGFWKAPPRSGMPNQPHWHFCKTGCPQGHLPCAATQSVRIAASSPGKCPNWKPTSTTGIWTSALSRSWPDAGLRTSLDS